MGKTINNNKSRKGSHYKQYTQLDKLTNQVKELKALKTIGNALLSNGCYHDKQMDEQFMKAEKNGNLTDSEREVIEKSWKIRQQLALELENDYKKELNRIEKEIKKRKKNENNKETT